MEAVLTILNAIVLLVFGGFMFLIWKSSGERLAVKDDHIDLLKQQLDMIRSVGEDRIKLSDEKRDMVARQLTDALRDAGVDHKIESSPSSESPASPIELETAAKYRISLMQGPNLVSIPGPPVDGDINRVAFAEDAIKLILTYDNPTGLWLVATRDVDSNSPTFGKFVGTLKDIDDRHAYWVLSDVAASISIPLAHSSGGLAIFPPALEVFSGWNLVPVIDLNLEAEGTKIEAAQYFDGLEWAVAYGYDTQKGAFKKILPPDSLQTGLGYFVYVRNDGVIIS